MYFSITNEEIILPLAVFHILFHKAEVTFGEAQIVTQTRNDEFGKLFGLLLFLVNKKGVEDQCLT